MSISERKYRVGISGSYGGLNLGDEAILESIISQLRASVPVHITVFSRNSADTMRRHLADHAIDIRNLSRNEARHEVEQLDVLVIGGGGIFFDGEAEVFLREANLAHELGVPVMIYAVGAGPLQKNAARQAVKETLDKATIITVRDRGGRALFEDIGVRREIRVTADPALLIEPKPVPDNILTREFTKPGANLVGFSVREPGPAAPDIDVAHYHRLLASAADFIVDRLDADIVFVPMEKPRMDLQHSHAVVSEMDRPDRASVLKGDWSPGQLITLMSRLDFAVGMRLHFLLFAVHQCVPFVALPYASKVTGLLADLEIEMPVLKNVTTGRLLAHIDRTWDLRGELRGRIERSLPDLRARARENNQLLVELLSAKTVTP